VPSHSAPAANAWFLASERIFRYAVVRRQEDQSVQGAKWPDNALDHDTVKKRKQISHQRTASATRVVFLEAVQHLSKALNWH
jgi:hypothetical protein